ncbi:MAG: hypothetical protein GXO83_05540 [Chlorobi bacterium]|nr:hypothetical protein [Chlorobiota bacterium]
MDTTSSPRGNITRVIAGIILITIASTFLLYQIKDLGYRFLKTSDKILSTTVRLSLKEQELNDEKVRLDEFNRKVNETNGMLGLTMKRSLQWNDSVQRLMEASLDNLELIQEIYEKKILPGEEKIDSLSLVFDRISDDLLSKMEQYTQHEITIKIDRIHLAGLKERRIFSLAMFLVSTGLFAGFLIYGFRCLQKDFHEGSAG